MSFLRVVEAFRACLDYKLGRYGLSLPMGSVIQPHQLQSLVRLLQSLSRHERCWLAMNRHQWWYCNGSDAVIKKIRDEVLEIFEGTAFGYDRELVEVIAEAGAMLLVCSEYWVEEEREVAQATIHIPPYSVQRERALSGHHALAC